jgi:hypothetical protein
VDPYWTQGLDLWVVGILAERCAEYWAGCQPECRCMMVHALRNNELTSELAVRGPPLAIYWTAVYASCGS